MCTIFVVMSVNIASNIEVSHSSCFSEDKWTCWAGLRRICRPLGNVFQALWFCRIIKCFFSDKSFRSSFSIKRKNGSTIVVIGLSSSLFSESAFRLLLVSSCSDKYSAAPSVDLPGTASTLASPPLLKIPRVSCRWMIEFWRTTVLDRLRLSLIIV